MKIALFTDTYLPDINGVVSSVVLLKKKLEEEGHEVWVVTNYAGMSKILVEDHIIRLPGLELKALYGYKMTQPMHLLFIDELKDLNFDIIHAQQEFGVGIYASIVAKVLHIPLVRTYHTAYEDYTSYFLPIKNEIVDSAAKDIIEHLSRLVGEDCMRMVAPSRKTKEMLERYGIDTPITVIPTGLELDRFKPVNQNQESIQKLRKELSIKDNELMFIYVGRVAGEKSIDMILKGFAKVAESKLPCKLVIVGGGPDLENLKELSNKLNLNDYVLFLGKKPNTEVPLYYNAADVFVSASITETQGMTYVEAMASGLPLICRKDEVLEDVLIEGENGYFFIDENEFASKAIEYINLTKEKRIKMSNNSLLIADKYDASLFGKNMAGMYKEVIDEYATSFVIEDTSVKDDCVVVNLDSGKTDDRISVSLDTYMELGLRKGTRISSEILERLRKEQERTLAYNKCIKKISVKDYTEREIRDYLYANYELSVQQIDEIIEKLKKYDFINDEKYAFNKATSYTSMLYSRKMIKKKLKEVGIREEIIDKCVNSTQEEELVKAKRMAEKLNLLIHGKSLKARKESLLRKLTEKGFDYDVSSQAIDMLDLNFSASEETELLKVEAFKQKLKYERKYEGVELRNHIFRSLVNKGFDYEKIYAVIDEMEDSKNEG